MTSVQRALPPQAFFLATETGARFCLFHASQHPSPKGRVLYLHPFAEELNSTRRVVAQQARALAQAGYDVLQIDLLGCGDSEGDFSDATWAAWLQDAHHALQWLQERSHGALWLWGMRSGALLAAELASHLAEPTHLLFWQPVASGQQQLQQFLRLHAAGQWLQAGQVHKSQPAQLLAQGQPVHIAGYTVSPALAQGLACAQLHPPPNRPAGRLVWLELSAHPRACFSPAATAHLHAWRQAGWQVVAKIMVGPAFWQVVGMDEAPTLVQATLQAMASSSPHAEAPCTTENM